MFGNKYKNSTNGSAHTAACIALLHLWLNTVEKKRRRNETGPSSTRRQGVRRHELRHMSKMDTWHKVTRVSIFFLSTLKPMQCIALDTIGSLNIAKQFKYIPVIIDTLTRYVELYLTKDEPPQKCYGSTHVVLERHWRSYRTTTHNQWKDTGYAALSGVRYHDSQGICWPTMNVLNWSQMLNMTEK